MTDTGRQTRVKMKSLALALAVAFLAGALAHCEANGIPDVGTRLTFSVRSLAGAVSCASHGLVVETVLKATAEKVYEQHRPCMCGGHPDVHVTCFDSDPVGGQANTQWDLTVPGAPWLAAHTLEYLHANLKHNMDPYAYWVRNLYIEPLADSMLLPRNDTVWVIAGAVLPCSTQESYQAEVHQ